MKLPIEGSKREILLTAELVPLLRNYVAEQVLSRWMCTFVLFRVWSVGMQQRTLLSARSCLFASAGY